MSVVIRSSKETKTFGEETKASSAETPKPGEKLPSNVGSSSTRAETRATSSKAAPTKTSAKKSSAKKMSAEKTRPQKSVPTKTMAKKTSATKTWTQNTAVKKAPTTKTPTRKLGATKTVTRNPTATKAPAKKRMVRERAKTKTGDTRTRNTNAGHVRTAEEEHSGDRQMSRARSRTARAAGDRDDEVRRRPQRPSAETERSRPVAGDGSRMTAPEEEVGYGKPPKAHRWKPGQSGNPKGKKKGTKHLSTIVRELAEKSIVAQDANGERRRLSRAEAMLLVTFNKATRGDIRAIQVVLNLLKEHLPEPDASDPSIPDAADLQVLKDAHALQALIEEMEDA